MNKPGDNTNAKNAPPVRATVPKLNLKEAQRLGPDSIGVPTVDNYDTLKQGGQRITDDEEEVILNLS